MEANFQKRFEPDAGFSVMSAPRPVLYQKNKKNHGGMGWFTNKKNKE
tara:strand:+ start:360 stop:500 length:141 start_codon:yes stop_codon:yes gene_type:complete